MWLTSTAAAHFDVGNRRVLVACNEIDDLTPERDLVKGVAPLAQFDEDIRCFVAAPFGGRQQELEQRPGALSSGGPTIPRSISASRWSSVIKQVAGVRIRLEYLLTTIWCR